MILADLTWQEVRDLPRDFVVVIPTGSLEQHGPHLTLFTDSRLVTAAVTEAERRLPQEILVTPTLWLGCSGHHLAMAGSLSADFESYMGAIRSVILSLARHGFWKFYIVNGHGGNTEPNGVVLRTLKEAHPHLLVGHSGYFAFGTEKAAEVMTGPAKSIKHSCEAEVSLMMHLFPQQVRRDKIRDDGLYPDPPVVGVIDLFDEKTQEGSLGYATEATAEKGKAMFDACIDGLCSELHTLHTGYTLVAKPKA